MNTPKGFMIRSGICISICFIFFPFTLTVQGQNLYDLDHSRRFASYLMQTGQYTLASNEWQRVLFLQPEDSMAKLNLLMSYRKAGAFNEAIKQLELWYQADPPLYYLREGLKSSFMDHQYSLAKKLLGSGKELPDEEHAWYELGLQIVSWSGKEGSLPRPDSLSYPGFNELLILSNEAMNIKMKSPALALTLSALLPGLGKVYSHDWKDGLFSLLFIGGNVLQAYRGFSKFGWSNPYGWIFGSLAVGFYSANLYGSWKSASNYNQRQIDRIHNEAENLLFSRF